MKTSRDIKPGNGDCSRLRINSREIRDRLVSLGFTHNKSSNIRPDDNLKNSKDFWRGCIDGDSGLYKHPSGRDSYIPHIFLCGTLETICDFILFCSRNLNIKDKYPTRAPGNNFYRVSYYGEDAKKITDLLYKDAIVYLERKYQIYKEKF